MPFLPPDLDDPASAIVGCELIEVRCKKKKKKKKKLKGFIVKPSVSDERLGAPIMVQLEERRQKRIHGCPPCDSMNAPHPEALLQMIIKRKGLYVIFFHLVDCCVFSYSTYMVMLGARRTQTAFAYVQHVCKLRT